MALKHIGRIKKTQKKCAVAYRLVPGSSDEAIIVPTETLMAEEHDELMKLIESNAGQTAYELAEAMARTRLPDGRIMLSSFHTTGKMIKVKTSEVEMIPDTKSVIGLDELLKIIATQKGVTVSDLALKNPDGSKPPKEEPVDPVELYSTETVPAEVESSDIIVSDDTIVTTEELLTDEKLAAQYRSQADALYKEAKKLRDQAEALVPTKRKTTKASSAKK